ncbi:MAG TPA: TRAP transporter small permease [Burkholderiales bacterium]|jgi:TRAP-type C4-dicarboxylate transport system permease small subunit|nr:TRAP transporter small permease [Burkholderiales bacterium]
MSVLSRAEGILIAGVRVIVGAAIFVSIGINFANIAGRYLFSEPILWAEEILNYLMVWSVFLGAVLVTWEGRHIRMDLLSARIPPPASVVLNVVTVAVFAAVCGFMIVQSWTVTNMARQIDQRSVAAEIPMAFAHVAVLLGFAGMLVAVLLRLPQYVRNVFGSETAAVQKQVTETFGTFE